MSSKPRFALIRKGFWKPKEKTQALEPPLPLPTIDNASPERKPVSVQMVDSSNAHANLHCTTCFSKGELCVASSSSTGDPLGKNSSKRMPARVSNQLALLGHSRSKSQSPSASTSRTTSPPSRARRVPGFTSTETDISRANHLSPGVIGAPFPLATPANVLRPEKRRGRKWKGKGCEGAADEEEPGLAHQGREWVSKVLHGVGETASSPSKAGKRAAGRAKRSWRSLRDRRRAMWRSGYPKPMRFYQES